MQHRILVLTCKKYAWICCVGTVVLQPQFIRLVPTDLNDFRLNLYLYRFGDFQQIDDLVAIGGSDLFGSGPLILIIDRPFQNHRLIHLDHPDVRIAEHPFNFVGNRRIGGRDFHLICLPTHVGPDDQRRCSGLFTDQNQFGTGYDHHVSHIRVGNRRPLQAAHIHRPRLSGADCHFFLP